MRSKTKLDIKEEFLLWMEVLLTDCSTACWGMAIQNNPGRSEQEIIQQWLNQRRT